MWYSFFSLKHWLAFFTWSEKVGGQWHLQVHALKSLQEVRLRCCDANRTCELSITYHANLESIIPQSYLASRVLFKKNKKQKKHLFVPHFPHLRNEVLILLN